ncbi:MAG TPA: iron-containing alcohol dehydrogenase [Candidatus Sulfotelmatobacter sp.]|nr:iron-containing alcohol dehydrogenase [Candidatus Sulfotelmatobacter sp.]
MAMISYLTRIQFDFGALKLLADELNRVGIMRPLIVSDKGVVAAGLVERVSAVLPADMSVTVYDGTPENPTEAAVDEALRLFREHGCDGLIGVGGGSALDLAKAVRLLATHPGPLAPYAMIEGGVARIGPNLAPMIALPTTAGTGSEVGRGALITLADGRKLGVVSPHLIPDVAICDPELTLGLPRAVTAGTGMDAIAHCIETFCSPLVNPPADAIALDGLARACRHIERACGHGADREARWNMMMAAMEGAMAFQKGLGAVHAMSHPLGSIQSPRLHHGTLNAVVLPAVLRFNHDALGDKVPRLAHAMGLAPGSDVADAIAKLNARVGMPAGLRAMGVTPEILPAMAEQAVKDHCNGTNPRQADAADYLDLLRAAMG